MIDFHSHILFNIDDGSTCELESLNMLKEAEMAGFTKIIATPHYIPESCENSKDVVFNKVSKLNDIANKNGIKIEICSGEEIYISNNLENDIKQDKVCTLNNTKYLLVELPMHSRAMYVENVIFNIKNMGYIPVIAHPERYDYVKEDIGYVEKLRQIGALMQSNYGSLIGKYGSTAQKTIEKLLKKQLVDFMGTDCHRAEDVYVNMSQALKKLKKATSKAYYEQLISDN